VEIICISRASDRNPPKRIQTNDCFGLLAEEERVDHLKEAIQKKKVNNNKKHIKIGPLLDPFSK
jgi:hypothetical protein